MESVHDGFRSQLNAWRQEQDPPWPWTYIAEKLGCSTSWVYKLNNEKNLRPGPELAYRIELMTKGELKMRDILLSPEDRQKIEREMQPHDN